MSAHVARNAGGRCAAVVACCLLAVGGCTPRPPDATTPVRAGPRLAVPAAGPGRHQPWTPPRSSSTGSTSTRRRSPTCAVEDAPSSATSTPARWRTGARTPAGTPTRSSATGLDDWQGERWLDIRATEVLRPILAERFDMCAGKGFTGVEADNVDGYTQDSGFDLTGDDQLRFNRMLAELAHERSLTIGLKNDLDQIDDLVGRVRLRGQRELRAVPRVRGARAVHRAGQGRAARRVRAGHRRLLPRHRAAGVPLDPQARRADGAGRAVPGPSTS